MRNKWLCRAVLAGAVGLGVLAGLARGQELPGPLPYPAPGSAYGSPYSGPGYGSPYPGPGNPLGGPDEQHSKEPKHFPRLAGAAGWVKQKIHNCPGNCATHHNDLGCSSLQSECKFAFGSCRTFFGEPCFRGRVPPPTPYGPGYGRPIDPRWPPPAGPIHP